MKKICFYDFFTVTLKVSLLFFVSIDESFCWLDQHYSEFFFVLNHIFTILSVSPISHLRFNFNNYFHESIYDSYLFFCLLIFFFVQLFNIQPVFFWVQWPRTVNFIFQWAPVIVV